MGQCNMMPMMMPMMDPRFMPQPFMMMDPRFMPGSPMMMPPMSPGMVSPSPTLSTTSSTRPRGNSQYSSKETDSHRRYEKRNMSSAGSVTESVYTTKSWQKRSRN